MLMRYFLGSSISCLIKISSVPNPALKPTSLTLRGLALRWAIGDVEPPLTLRIFDAAAGDVEPPLTLRVLDAAAGDVEILGFAFDADEAAAEVHARDARGAAAHEWVQDGVAAYRKHVRHERNRLASDVKFFLRLCRIAENSR